MLGGENMCIDDNIPADNYCGIILKAEQQEDTDIYGNVKWRRIYPVSYTQLDVYKRQG